MGPAERPVVVYILGAFAVFMAITLGLAAALPVWIGCVAALSLVLVSVLSASEVGRRLGSRWASEA